MSRRGWLACLCLVALPSMAAAVAARDVSRIEAGEDTLVRHFGPVGVEEGQLVVVSLTNRGRVTLTADAVVLDEAGQAVTREQVELQPGQSQIVSWAAPAAHLVRGLVSVPAVSAAEVPAATYVYNGPSDPQTSPALTLAPSPPHGMGVGQAITTATAPYAPIIIALQGGAGRLQPTVANLGPRTAMFTVSYFDERGTLLLEQALTVAPGQIGRSQAGPLGARVEVAAPRGAVYLSTVEHVDAAGKTTAVLGTVSR